MNKIIASIYRDLQDYRARLIDIENGADLRYTGEVHTLKENIRKSEGFIRNYTLFLSVNDSQKRLIKVL